MKSRFNIFAFILLSFLSALSPLNIHASDIQLDIKKAIKAPVSLMEAEKLFQNMRSYFIFDTRPATQFTEGHIPGARNLDWETMTEIDSAGVPYRLPSFPVLSEHLGNLGLQNRSAVLVYGSGIKNWGAEGWAVWLLTYLGHTGDIFLLKSGWKAWESKGYPIEAGPTEKAENTRPYTYRINASVFADLDALRSKDTYLVDTRTLFERLLGSIPGSIHISWKDFFESDGRTPLNKKDFNGLMNRYNIKTDQPVIYFCTGGIRSSWAWLTHHMSGYSPAKNFEGSMALWEKRPDR